MLKDTLAEKGLSLPEGFTVGSARASLNPPLGISLAGHGMKNAIESRHSTVNWDELMLCCTAYSDGENLALMFTYDSCQFGESVAKPLFRLLEETYGIPEENVVFSGTHTHAGPVMYSRNECFPKVPEFLDTMFAPEMLRITEEAIRDLTPATVFIGRGKTEGLNFVRRYISKKDGSFLGNWPKEILDPEEAMHESEVDEEMQVVRFVREGKKDVILVNWQCHPTSAGGHSKTNTSADWPGIIRNTVGEKEDALVVYHQGACGNIIPFGKIKGERSFAGDAFREHGALLSEKVLEILKNNMTPAKAGKVQIRKNYLPVPHIKPEKGDLKVPVTAVALGDVSFATVPYEMFHQNGQQVKSGSPFEMTFVCEVTNGDFVYVPAAECYANGGYEVSITPLAKGGGEKIANHLVEMLTELHKNN